MADKDKKLAKMFIIISSILSALISIFIKDWIESMIQGSGAGIVIYRCVMAIVIGLGIGYCFTLFIGEKTI